MLSENMRKALENIKIYSEDGREISEIGELTVGVDMSESHDQTAARRIAVIGGSGTFSIKLDTPKLAEAMDKLKAQLGHMTASVYGQTARHGTINILATALNTDAGQAARILDQAAKIGLLDYIPIDWILYSIRRAALYQDANSIEKSLVDHYRIRTDHKAQEEALAQIAQTMQYYEPMTAEAISRLNNLPQLRDLEPFDGSLNRKERRQANKHPQAREPQTWKKNYHDIRKGRG